MTDPYRQFLASKIAVAPACGLQVSDDRNAPGNARRTFRAHSSAGNVTSMRTVSVTDGSGGAIEEADIRDSTVRELLAALAAREGGAS